MSTLLEVRTVREGSRITTSSTTARNASLTLLSARTFARFFVGAWHHEVDVLGHSLEPEVDFGEVL